MNPERGHDLVNAARSAEALLAEVPSRRVRENVLRVARQAVRPAGGAGPAAHRRWPMALAASVLVGTVGAILTVQLSRKVEPVQLAMASREVATPAASATSGAAPAVAQSRSKVTTVAAASGPREARTVAGGVAPVGSPVPFPARAAPQSPPLQLTQEMRADRLEGAKEVMVPQSANLATAAPAARAADAASAPAAVLGAQQWIDRILALRRNGRQDDADRELAELRKRYPTLEIPRAAMRPVP